ncbi:MAG TPA: alpha-E domain-containing protein, partial [Caldimonas sp.]|nr:alpha-E domain-containing protein [Caldimonas sp.]
QMSLLPQSEDAAERGWRGLLGISELTGEFAKRHPAVTAASVIDFMVSDEANPSSIRSCLLAARENARAVRGTLTTEVWETQNQTWLEFQRMVGDDAFQRAPSEAFEWVKFRSHLSRGVTVGTMLQDEAFHFLRIGSFLERADNTARLLDVKFHAAPESARSGRVGRRPSARSANASSQSQSQSQSQTQSRSQPAVSQAMTTQGEAESPGKDEEFDFYHWSAVLRSVSGFEIYRRVYRNVIRPERVAELLVLRADMPRSLAACVHEVVTNLERVANSRSQDTLRLAGRLAADLRFGRIDEILATGLHAYLTQFLERINTLGAGISRDFLVPMAD